MGDHFIIKVDQKSLKWLLQLKISIPFQQFWSSKLMGFYYEIQYKAGKENVVADALSRAQGSSLLCMAISVLSSDLHNLFQQSYALDNYLILILQQLHASLLVQNFTLQNELLKRKDKLYLALCQSQNQIDRLASCIT